MLSNLKIDVDQIRTYVAVAEHGSISRAAEAMDVSPSTVNSRIRALGKELDANLMERSSTSRSGRNRCRWKSAGCSVPAERIIQVAVFRLTE